MIHSGLFKWLAAVSTRLRDSRVWPLADVAALLVFFPVACALCAGWGIVPNWDLRPYLFVQGLTVLLAVVPALAAMWIWGLLQNSKSPLDTPRGTPRGSWRIFLRYMLVFVATSWIYSHIKAGVLLRPPVDRLLLEWELWICGGATPWTILRSSLPGWTAGVWHFVYMIFYPVLMGTIFVLCRRGHFREAGALTTSLCLAYLVGALAYHVLPSYGPCFATASASCEAVSPAAYHLQQLLLDRVTRVQTDPSAAVIEPWKYIGAFPSLHASHVLLLCWYLRKWPTAATVAGLFALATLIATIYLGWHYALDWMGGALLAVVVAVFVAVYVDRVPTPSLRGGN